MSFHPVSESVFPVLNTTVCGISSPSIIFQFFMVWKDTPQSPSHNTLLLISMYMWQINMGTCGVVKEYLVNSLQIHWFIFWRCCFCSCFGAEAVWNGAVLVIFQRNLLPPSSGVKLTGEGEDKVMGQGRGIRESAVLVNKTCGTASTYCHHVNTGPAWPFKTSSFSFTCRSIDLLTGSCYPACWMIAWNFWIRTVLSIRSV
jgi:hypothetical protein